MCLLLHGLYPGLAAALCHYGYQVCVQRSIEMEHLNRDAASRSRMFGNINKKYSLIQILPRNRDSKGPSRDKFHFWRQIKNVRGNESARVLAIKCTDSVVRHEVLEVLKVWKEHFHKIGTPKADPTYDDVDR